MIVLGLDGKTHLRKAALTGRVRHNKPQLSAPTLKLVNARTFPLYTPRLFAAMPIRSYLGGQRFDPATIPRVGDGPSFLRLVVN